MLYHQCDAPSSAWVRRRSTPAGVGRASDRARSSHAPLGEIERRRLAVARTRQIGDDFLLQPAGARAHHQDPVGEHDGFIDVVGDDNNVGFGSAHRSSRWSCRSTRVKASSAENGSSSSSTSGRVTSARASATRCACPPESSRGHRRPSRRGRRARAAPRPARRARQRAIRETEADVVGDRQPRKQPRLLKHDADLFMRRVIGIAVEHDTRPGLGVSSPEMARSSVDLPQPEPPMTTTISPGSTVERNAFERVHAVRDRSCRRG